MNSQPDDPATRQQDQPRRVRALRAASVIVSLVVVAVAIEVLWVSMMWAPEQGMSIAEAGLSILKDIGLVAVGVIGTMANRQEGP